MNRLENINLDVVNMAFFREGQKPTNNQVKIPTRRLYSKKRLAVGFAASAFVLALEFTGLSDDQTKENVRVESVATTPVTLVNGGELFHFVKDTSDDPNVRNRAGLYPLSQDEKDELVTSGFDPNNAQIINGRENHGPLRRSAPGQDISTGIEPYVEVLLPNGEIYHTPKSNIKNT